MSATARRPILNGEKFVFGIQEPKPIVDGILGAKSCRLRMRPMQPAKLYARLPNGISVYLLLDHGEHWRIGPELGRNIRTPAWSP